MMNFGNRKLDHILSIGKSSSDHHSLGYQHGEDLNTQGVLVKASPPTTSPPVAKIPYL